MHSIFYIGKEFHQYDSVAYPKLEESNSSDSLWQSINKGIKSLMGSSSKSVVQKNETLDQQSMQSNALETYLNDYKRRFCEFDFSSLDAQIATEDIMYIFKSLKSVRSCVNDCKDLNTFNCTKEVFSKVRFL